VLFGPSLPVRGLAFTLPLGIGIAPPFFKALMIATLVSPGGGGAVTPGVLEPFVDVSNERVCMEYSFDSIVYGRIYIEPAFSLSTGPFRVLFTSKRLKLNDVGEPSREYVGSFVKYEAGKPLELKAASTRTVEEFIRTSDRGVKGNGWRLTEVF